MGVLRGLGFRVSDGGRVDTDHGHPASARHIQVLALARLRADKVGSCLATVERAWRTIQQREASCSCDRLARTESARPFTTGATLPLGLSGQQNTLRCRLVQKQENISCLDIVGHALESE